ncbi:hypothetical protein LAZ67_6004035 [Cordylochernes scorpioides]|nr:hypothetical protein LAZ67_6004035 [Cordylochernes scorpioides]
MSSRQDSESTLDHRNHAKPSSSSSSSSTASLARRSPPDGGWGWVVVFASFMVNLIADGVSLSFGLLFLELVEYFDASKSKTAFVGSIFLSMPLLTGPIASYLTDRHGCRTVSLVGGALSAGGFAISYFAGSLEVLFITFTISGFGLALCYVASIVIVAYYFEKLRSFATGLAVCGTGIGTLIFPPFTLYLLEKYGWRGTLLILAGFFLNMMVFGALMRDLDDDEAAAPAEETPEEIDPPRLSSSLVQLPTYMKGGSVPVEVISELSSKEGGYLSSLLRRYPSLLTSFLAAGDPTLTVKSTPPVVTGPPVVPLASRKPSAETAAFLRHIRLQRGSITYRGAMLHIRRYRLRASSCPDIYRNSMVTLPDSSKVCPLLRDLKELLLDMVDLSMFRSVHYSLFCISNFLLYAFVDVPYVYLPDSAVSIGVDKDMASYVISVLGFLNTAGVVIVGYVGDKPWVSSTLLYSGFMVLSGVSMGLVPLARDYSSLFSLAAIYGFAISANYTLVPVIVVDIISLDSFTGAYGLLLLVQGVASLVGPPLAGWLFDLTNSYDLTFYLTGLCIIISGILTAPIRVGRKHESPPSPPKTERREGAEKVRFCLETNGHLRPSQVEMESLLQRPEAPLLPVSA